MPPESRGESSEISYPDYLNTVSRTIKSLHGQGVPGPQLARTLLFSQHMDVATTRLILHDLGFLCGVPEGDKLSVSLKPWEGEVHPRVESIDLTPPSSPESSSRSVIF